MDSKNIKDQMDAINALEGGLQDFAKRLPGIMEPFMEEQKKLLVPKSKKDIMINGKPCAISLLKDGRIMINLGTLDDAQQLYNDTNKIDKQFYEGVVHEQVFMYTKIIDGMKEEIAKLEAEVNKKWWRKIFK